MIADLMAFLCDARDQSGHLRHTIAHNKEACLDLTGGQNTQDLRRQYLVRTIIKSHGDDPLSGCHMADLVENLAIICDREVGQSRVAAMTALGKDSTRQERAHPKRKPTTQDTAPRCETIHRHTQDHRLLDAWKGQ